MAAAGAARTLGEGKVIVLEKMARPGRKIMITGKGRCNFTNLKQWNEFQQHVHPKPGFLKSAFYNLSAEKMLDFMEDNSMAYVVERGDRAFPESHLASDVVDALVRAAQTAGAEILCGKEVKSISYLESPDSAGSDDGTSAKQFELKCADGSQYICSKLIICTGGLSYPKTGSTGDGYRMAAAAGHTVVEPTASLVPLVSDDPACPAMQGLALKNIRLTVRNQKKKVVFEDFGEMLFTHFGMSGPLILSASAHMRDFAKNQYTVSIDLKPALDEKKLETRVLRDMEERKNQNFTALLGGLVPHSMVPVLAERCGISGDTKVHSVTKEQRRTLESVLKRFDIRITGTRSVAEAIVTSGGIKTGEINPNTMESKTVKGLYFAGELIDTDAYTGGFNLQIAWATGRAAGQAAAAEE
jgi:predicted Rossmann fold flavoprotein